MYSHAESNKNAVVGSPGTKIPITPSASDKDPHTTNMPFNKFKMLSLL
jgi:hypothetical protein